MRRILNLSLARLLPAAILLFSALSLTAVPALAHPAPSVLHDYIVSMNTTSLTIEAYLRVSPELVPQVYRELDTDGNGKTSQDEIDAWFRNHPARLQVSLDEKPLKLSISQAPPLGKEDLLSSIDRPLHWTYTSTWDTPISGKHRIKLTYGDNYIDYDEYYISVANDTANDNSPQQVSKARYPASFQIVYHIPAPQEAGSVPQGEMAPPPYYAGAQASPTAAGEATPLASLGQSGGQSGFLGQVMQNLRGWHGEFWSGLGMILLALVIGALHALTPGHGKTMVAAYLIGTKGRVRDAALLGGVVTFTHTAGVVLLGLILLLVSNFTVPRGLQPTLELIAGVIIVLLGVYLLVTRWRGTQAQAASIASNSTPGDNRARARQTAPAVLPALAGAQVSAAQALPVRSAAAHESGGGHSHDHGHDLAHGIAHSHGGQTHTHELPQERVSLSTLIGLGVSGGLVPCPDALAILLLAAGVGQFALGLGLVVSFSLGLAAVLISIGIVLVKAKGALERTRAAGFTRSDLWMRWVPVASAGVVLVIGLVMAVSALRNLA